MEETDGLNHIDSGEADKIMAILREKEEDEGRKQKQNIYDEQEVQGQGQSKQEQEEENQFKITVVPQIKPAPAKRIKSVEVELKGKKQPQIKNSKPEKDHQKRIDFTPEIKQQAAEVEHHKQIEEKLRKQDRKKSLQSSELAKKQRSPIISNTSSPAIRSLKSIKSIGNDQQFDKISRKTRETFRSTRSSCEDYLGHIFDYYCKDPTFDEISQKVRIMTITNFMLFCRDFKIRDNIQRMKLVQIFKKNSSFHKHLNPDQFHAAVGDLADIIFESHEEERRFGRMLVFLQIHNSYAFVRKMNELGVVFRMKNKRGKEVRVTPRYTFKLTPNNGKTEEQIALEVKERNMIRKIMKSEQVQLHRKNKLNKIDQLYKNGAKKKKQKSLSPKEEGDQVEAKYSQIKLKPKQTVQDQQTETRRTQGYYNPCEIFSARSDNTYGKINEMKKIQSIARLKKQQANQAPSKQLRKSQNSILGLQTKEMKVNQIIKMAKDTIEEQPASEPDWMTMRDHGSIKKQSLKYASICKNSGLSDKENLCQSRYIGGIVKNCQGGTRNCYQPRKSKEIQFAQMMVESQIKDISRVITEGEVKPRQFLRATAKVQRQNMQEMQDLEDMIGASKEDELLTKHFSMQRKYEQNLSNI